MYYQDRPAMFMAEMIRWRTDNPAQTVADAITALTSNQIEYKLFGISLDVAKGIVRNVYGVTTERNTTAGSSGGSAPGTRTNTGVNVDGHSVRNIRSTGGIVSSYDPSTSTVSLSMASTHSVGNYFVGIYDTLKDLQDSVANPANNYQAIVIQPSESYYHSVGGAWVKLAPLSSIHPSYLGTYDTIQDATTANPSPVLESLAIIGTSAKQFYIYTSTGWAAVGASDLSSLTSRMLTAEGHLQTLQTDDIQTKQRLTALESKTPVAPTFDPAMFQSAVDHGYAADDQGIKSSKTTSGWWIFKDLASVGARPSDSVGDLFVFRNNLDTANPAVKHVFIMAIGKDTKLQNTIWFMYRDGTTWTPWFNVEGANQDSVDTLANSVDELKRSNQATLNELAKLQTAAGKLYAPTKEMFDSSVNALIQAALKNYTPSHSGHSGDKPETVYPRIYAQFSNTIPTDFTGATTSTNSALTLVSAPSSPSRIFVSVENDNDEASKVKGFKFNHKQEMTLQHRDIVVDGTKYRSFYTAGAFSEAGIEIEVDFGQGI